ncbi:2-amino-4-hydroxy-6-hydroxymethyldihydropteridine diphosphokinase [Deinococcus aetherius]|uniref:2-amino-4-hydroxy-6-hydroxymethyldihydropteridine diphosphokinase n=1 Tax=Deinococcus aetherius TaxID=200252 RepID=A0ABM8AGX0_9DEIO|nr:2-amino-4-hydroxy-6-hydroxymethyldihydropteridine diphosphokinase [Deinococcus aetherius]BDP43036.1 2-amino-4-hydroxy-6-hydroxymethyldihydropteridine diphosphokinase [Deinococcus aetherius]
MAPGEAAFIALGANLGDAPGTLRGARDDLARLGTLTGVSGLYRTVPVGGPPGQPDYLNAAVRLVTPLGPVELLGALHEIERQAGRVRRDRWAARTLDLDLILYGHEVRDTPGLALPHPRAWERAFVLAPLADLDPHLAHPTSGETVGAALARVGREGVTLAAPEW